MEKNADKTKEAHENFRDEIYALIKKYESEMSPVTVVFELIELASGISICCAPSKEIAISVFSQITALCITKMGEDEENEECDE